jgi:hypothetical protein
VIHTNRSGIADTYESVRINADNALFGYWTSIVDDDVPYPLLREAILNHMYPLKKHFQAMRKAGLMYSSHGTPFSVN